MMGTRSVKFAHCSMQYSDSRTMMAHDVAKIVGRGYDVITGTEAGNNPLRQLWARAAQREGYRFHIARSVYVLVKRELVRGDWRDGYVPVIESYEGRGRHSDRGLAWCAFDATDNLGRIAVAAGHYLTKGRHRGDPNHQLNREMGGAIGEWSRRMGRRTGLAFYGGDQNIVDRREDTFFGSPLTSAWDELGRWENTGHGNIDVIASYDRDGRVEAKRVRALDDSELELFTDHFLVEATYKVRQLQD